MAPQRGILSLRALFVVLFLAFLIYESLERPRVLILHSYATDFGWVNDINHGIDRVFAAKGYSVRYFYIDTKRHPFEDFKLAAGRNAMQMIENWRPDVIIAADDNAQQYAAHYYVNHPDIDVVFCGINIGKDNDAYGYNSATNVTGVYENLPWSAIVEQQQLIMPEGKGKILHLSDDSPSSHAVHERVGTVDWGPFEFMGSYEIGTLPEWKQMVGTVGQQADCILITHYHTILEEKDSKVRIAPQEVLNWTLANTRQLLIGTFPFFMDHGGSLVIGVSAYEQGETAARLSARVIDEDIRAGSLPPVNNEMFVVLIRETELNNRVGGTVHLPLVLRSFAHAIGGYEP